MDAWDKSLAVEGEGSKAHLSDYLWSLKDVSGGGALPSSPGGSSFRISLPTFPTHLPYFSFIEPRTYQIRHAPTPKAMTFPGHAGDEVLSFRSIYLVFSIHVSIADDFFASFSGGLYSGR